MRIVRPLRFSLLLCTVAAVGYAVCAPMVAAPNDAKALAHLPAPDRELVTASCQHIANQWGVYHPCVASFAASDEMAFFAAMPFDQKTPIYTACQKYWVFDTDEYINCFVRTVDSMPGYASKNPPYAAPKSLNTRVADAYSSAWTSSSRFFNGNAALIFSVVALLALVFFIRSLFFGPRPQAVTVYTPPVYQEPDPYRSSAAMNDFAETGAFGDGRFSSASDLGQAMRGNNSHGQQPQFEE